MRTPLSVLVIIIFLSHGLFGQDTPSTDPPVTQTPDIQTPNIQTVELPELTVSTQDIIDIMAEFTVVQETGTYFCNHFYGLTDLDNKTISICAKYDTTAKRKTVLHEILHIVYWKRGIYTSGVYEYLIDLKATALFKSLYGFPAPIRVSTGEPAYIPEKTDTVPSPVD